MTFLRSTRTLGAVFGAMLAIQTTGCGTPDGPPARVSLPAGWSHVDPRSVTVPGTPLVAWNGPDDASLALYRSLAIPEPSPAALARETARRYENFAGVTIRSATVQTLPSGRSVARVEATGPGTGDAWVPTPLGTPVVPKGKAVEPTDRILVGIPRPGDTLWLVAHYPESGRDQVHPVIDSAIASLVVDAGTTDVSSYAD